MSTRKRAFFFYGGRCTNQATYNGAGASVKLTTIVTICNNSIRNLLPTMTCSYGLTVLPKTYLTTAKGTIITAKSMYMGCCVFVCSKPIGRSLKFRYCNLGCDQSSLPAHYKQFRHCSSYNSNQ